MNKLILYKPLHPNFHIFQGFGECSPDICEIYKNMGLKGHNGLDCNRLGTYVEGAYVRASHDGEVTYAGIDSSGGYGVVLKTLEEFDYLGKLFYFKTIYWHLRKEIQVKVGQKVKVGDVLGYADNTGISKGSHLHFGLKPILLGENEWTWYNLEQDNGYFGAIDPASYLSNLSA